MSFFWFGTTVIAIILWLSNIIADKSENIENIYNSAYLQSQADQLKRTISEQKIENVALIQEIAELETLICLKDEELNNREDERELAWDEMIQYLIDAKTAQNKNTKLVPVDSCLRCPKKDTCNAANDDIIPKECPLKDAHVLYGLQITAKGFSLGKLVNSIKLKENQSD